MQRACGGVSNDSGETAATPAAAWGSGGGGGDGLDPALLSGADKEDAADDNEYAIGDNGADKPLLHY
jgi:hypothetical protein